MNARLRFALLTLSMTGLAACASTGTTSSAAPAAARPMTQIEQDSAYVAKVEYLARRRGVHLTWVNPPTRRVEPTQP